MKKSILRLGEVIDKTQQKKINGKGLSACSTYSGPFSFGENACRDYQALPDIYKSCVVVHSDCTDNSYPI